MLKIINVESSSPADLAGLRAGDRIVSINGQAVEDFIDFHFHAADSFLEIVVSPVGCADLRTFTLEREPGRGLGLDVEQQRIKTCRNRCIFCFVDQLPRGLRRSLYVKDEDYRYSFLQGNFITGTHLSEREISRIIRMGLSPLYISLHATQPSIRRKILGTSSREEIMPLLQRLIAGGVRLHGQVVLCPGINDGPVLERTIEDFDRLGPGALSLAVVPVGLSGHRQHLARIHPVTPAVADYTLRLIHRRQREFRRKRGGRFVFAADEFYLLAGRRIPSHKAYEGYPQIENGVGLVRSSIESLSRYLKRGGPLPSKPGGRCRIVTAPLYQKVLSASLLPRLEGLLPWSFEITVVANSLLGESITVAGLMAGRDILRALENAEPADFYILPAEAVNDDGCFLDDLHLDQISEVLKPGKVLLARDFAQALAKIAELEVSNENRKINS
jgi:putative radical SAM enzyme (TIGR03279 family)